MNLFEQQAANRRKSGWLVCVFVLFFAWLGFGGDFMAWQFTARARPRVSTGTPSPGSGSLLVAVAYGLVRLHPEDRAPRRCSGRPAPGNSSPPDTDGQRRLENVVEEMAIAAGVPPPDHLYR